MKISNGILGGSDLYKGHVTVIKGSAFMNLRDSDQSEISERFVRQASFRRSSMCELL
jgi:hypothetical protein